MDDQKTIAQELAALLKEYRQEISVGWADQVHQLLEAPCHPLTLDECRVLALQIVDLSAEALASDSWDALKAFLTQISQDQLKLGVHFVNVVEARLLLKDVTLSVIRRIYPSNSTTAWDLCVQLDDFIRRMIGYLDELNTAETRLLLYEQQSRTQIMLEMAQTASSSLDLETVLSRVADGIASAAGVEYCGLFLIDKDQGTALPTFAVTVEPIRIAAMEKGEVLDYVPQPVTSLSPFIREVMAEKEPLTCYDVQQDPRFDGSVPRELGFRSILAVPFVAKGRVVAIAYALTFEECRTFSEEQIKLAKGIASAVALAIENARLHQQVHSLAALEERDRLAREMHDSLAQSLSTVKLQASYLGELLRDGQIEQAQAWLNDLKQTITEVHTDVREGIFNLRTRVSPGANLVQTLQQYLTKYQAYHGMDVRLVVETDTGVRLVPESTTQVLRIVQEALANIHKHAGTNQAEVRIEALRGDFCVTIEDQGVGFDVAQLASDAQPGYGLQVMRERAQGLGGSLQIESYPQGGTRIVIRVPRGSLLANAPFDTAEQEE